MTASLNEPRREAVQRNAADLLELLNACRTPQSHRAQESEPKLRLVSAKDGASVEVDSALERHLAALLEAVKSGGTVRVLPVDNTIGTQETAEILGMSRPTVVRLIEEGRLPATVPGVNRRRLRLEDVIEFRDQLRTEREDFLLGDADFDPALEVTPEEAVGMVRRVRQERQEAKR